MPETQPESAGAADGRSPASGSQASGSAASGSQAPGSAASASAAAVLPRLRSRMTPGSVLTTGSLGLAVVALILGYVHVTAVVAAALVLGGLAWILALSTLSSLYQLTLPGWVKARGMSYYLIVFQGGNAVGSAVLGVTAEHAGLSPTLLIAAVALALGPLAGLRYKFRAIDPNDLRPGADWPPPPLDTDDQPVGPVLVTVEYHPRDGLEQELLTELRHARFSRRRTGATTWRVWQDAAEPDRIMEQFVVASWEDHIRQAERVTVRDQQRLDRIRGLTDPGRPTVVTHWLTPQPERGPERQPTAGQPPHGSGHPGA